MINGSAKMVEGRWNNKRFDLHDKPTLLPEFITRIEKAESGKFVKVLDFRKRYGSA